MKVIIYLFLFLTLISATSMAQRFNGGLTAGLCASQVDGDSYAGFDKLGLIGGVYVNTLFNRNIGAQLEIKYTGKGARKKTSIENPKIYSLSLHYVDLPILLYYEGMGRYIAEAGLVPGYMFFAVGRDDGGRVNSDQMNDFRKFDLAWLLGARYRINQNFSVGLRYNYSFISINKSSHSAQYSWFANMVGYNRGDYNNYLTFGFYYQFL